MSFSKYIVTHCVNFGSEGVTSFNNAFLIPNHYNHSLASFKELVKEARKSFPGLKDDDVECRTVVESPWCKRCPAISFPLPAGEAPTVEGWTNCKDRLPSVVLS